MSRLDREMDSWCCAVLGRWLLRWRAAVGISQDRLARVAGVDQSYISRVERGQRKIGGAHLARVILALEWFSGAGIDDGPFAASDLPLPGVNARLAGPRPPVILGIPCAGEFRGDEPREPPDAPADAVGEAASRRRSRLSPPSVAEALQTRRSRRGQR